jgi:hypothetical protein
MAQLLTHVKMACFSMTSLVVPNCFRHEVLQPPGDGRAPSAQMDKWTPTNAYCRGLLKPYCSLRFPSWIATDVSAPSSNNWPGLFLWYSMYPDFCWWSPLSCFPLACGLEHRCILRSMHTASWPERCTSWVGTECYWRGMVGLFDGWF